MRSIWEHYSLDASDVMQVKAYAIWADVKYTGKLQYTPCPNSDDNVGYGVSKDNEECFEHSVYTGKFWNEDRSMQHTEKDRHVLLWTWSFTPLSHVTPMATAAIDEFLIKLEQAEVPAEDYDN